MSEIRGVLTAMATPFERGGSGRRGRGPPPRRPPGRARLARGRRRRLDRRGGDPRRRRAHRAAARRSSTRSASEATVICGTGTNDTRHSIELTKAAAEAGAEAALVVTPYYNKPNPAGIRAHFEAIAAAVPDLPLIAYNIPSRVVVNVPPARARRAGQDRQRGRGQAGQQRRAAADRGAGAPGRQRRRLPARRWSSAAPAASSSPRTWSARRCGRCGTPPRPATSSGRARSTPACGRSTTRWA